MSSTTDPAAPSSNLQSIFSAALEKYTEQTGKDLQNDPLAAEIRRCQSPDDILSVFQAKAREFDKLRSGDSKLMKYLNSIIDGLHALSNNAALSAGVSLVFPPAQIIFSSISVLLTAAKGVRDGYDTLVEVLECIENFLMRLTTYTRSEIELTPAMTEILVKIVAEFLSVIALATNWMNEGRLKKFAKKLLGDNDVQAVLGRLDRLTQEESRATAAQTLEVIYGLANNMTAVMEDGKASTEGVRQALGASS
ncbi:hypothetical protein BJV78DRAFT_1356816 [Lactifluus subvellereus]|nr:hypothetical protein BJV78DRAFT_1356816 [Lactifluus subvellereus]